MGLEAYYGRGKYPVKCQLYAPVYDDNGKTIGHTPSEKFCFCKELQPFQIAEEREQNRRKKVISGTLETIYLKKEEITIDWKIEIDGKKFIIESLTQHDNDIQQTVTKNAVVTTTLKVRC